MLELAYPGSREPVTHRNCELVIKPTFDSLKSAIAGLFTAPKKMANTTNQGFFFFFCEGGGHGWFTTTPANLFMLFRSPKFLGGKAQDPHMYLP